jgi:hypothetical protein
VPGRREEFPMHAALRGILPLCIVLAALAGGPVRPVLAAPVALPQTITAGGATWDIRNTGGTDNGLPTGGICNGSPGLSVFNASIPGQPNTFDHGNEIWVNDSIFVAPALVDLNGQTITAGPVAMSGLGVTVAYRALDLGSHPFLRTLATFENPGASTLTVTVKLVTNLHSDANTTVEGTSNGNTTFTNIDAWVVTSDIAPFTDPVVATAFHGPSIGPSSPRVTSSQLLSAVFTCFGTQGFLQTYAVTVPPGGVRRLMFLTGLGPDVEEALLAAALFSETNPASNPDHRDFVADLTQISRSQILNWDFLLKETSGDFNGDGRADIMTGTGFGGAAHIRVFSFPEGAVNPIELFNFFAFDPAFIGGVRIAACDLNGDGVPDIVAAAGPGGGSHVRTFDGTTSQQLPGAIGSFFPYDPGYTGGTYVACNDVNGDGVPDIITGTGVGGGPHVRVWNGVDGTEIVGFFPYDPGFTGGVFVGP